jgi:hypothetical protein
MRRLRLTAAMLLTLAVVAPAHGGDDHPCEPAGPGLFTRLQPAGGWDPYGGGLLRWWNPHCFPKTCGPDDYCRKNLPCVCWPPYPPFYQWGTPEPCARNAKCVTAPCKPQ